MAKKASKRASTKRAKKTETPEVEAAPAPLATISERDFGSLLRQIKSAEANKNEAVGTIGSLVASAVEKKNLDKKAFGIFRGLARMSDDRLATTLAHLQHYIVIGKLNERAANQEQMFERTELAEAEAPIEAEAANGRGARKKKPPRKGSFAEKLAEAALDRVEAETREAMH